MATPDRPEETVDAVERHSGSLERQAHRRKVVRQQALCCSLDEFRDALSWGSVRLLSATVPSYVNSRVPGDYNTTVGWQAGKSDGPCAVGRHGDSLEVDGRNRNPGDLNQQG